MSPGKKIVPWKLLKKKHHLHKALKSNLIIQFIIGFSPANETQFAGDYILKLVTTELPWVLIFHEDGH